MPLVATPRPAQHVVAVVLLAVLAAVLVTLIGILGACGGSQRADAWLSAAEFRARGGTGRSVKVPLLQDDERVGTVTLSSAGAFVTSMGARRLPVVHVRLSVTNLYAAPLRVPLPALALEPEGGVRQEPLAIFGEEGSVHEDLAIAPSATRTLDIVFASPTGTDVDDVPSFAFAWTVALPSEAVQERTSFHALPGTGQRMARIFRPVPNR